MNTNLTKKIKQYPVVHACFQGAKPLDTPNDSDQTVCLGTVTYLWPSILGLLVLMLQGCFQPMVLVQEHW